jgi:hypothetical protein
MRRIITAREQAEMLGPWTHGPTRDRKNYEKKIKGDPGAQAEWASRPKNSEFSGKERLPQPTLPGMEKVKGEVGRLMRGVPVDTHDPAFRKVWQMTYGQGQPVDDPGLFPDADIRYDDRGGEFDHPGLADAILDGFRAKGGTGEHWSTDFDVADNYGRGIGEGSYNSSGYGRYLPTFLDADWNHAGENYNRAGSGNFNHEYEVMLKHKKAPLTIRDLRVPHNAEESDDFSHYGNDWNPIMDHGLRDDHITASRYGYPF